MNMKVTRCKLSKKVQSNLLNYFVAEVTARTAADLFDINRNTATLFYRKIREVIVWNLEKEAHQHFVGEVEGLEEKSLYLVS